MLQNRAEAGKAGARRWIADDCPSELAAFVDVSSDTARLLTKPEVASFAQQHSNGRFHLYMYVDPAANPRGPKASMKSEFDAHLFERKAAILFGPG